MSNFSDTLTTSQLQKIKAHYSQHGLFKLCTSIAMTFVSKIFYTNVDLVMSLSLLEAKNSNCKGKLVIIPVDENNTPVLREFCGNNKCSLRNTRMLNSYLRNKFNGYVATIDSKIIGYFWWVDNHLPRRQNHPHIVRCGLNLKDNEAYTFDFFIAPEHRGGGNAVAFLSKVHRKLKAMGFQRIYGQVSADNKPARWLYKLNGYKELRQVKSCRIFKLILITNKTVFIRNNRLISSYSFDYKPLFDHALKKYSTGISKVRYEAE